MYMRFVTILYAKTMGLSFIAAVVRHYDSERVALVICKLQRIYVTSGAASVYFDDADNATCKSRVGLPYSVLPVAERTIFGFGCERTRGS